MEFKETTSLLSMWIKVLTGFVLSKLFKRKGNRRIILTGRNLGGKYEDSIAVFHQYLLEHYSKTYDIYWLYDPKTTSFLFLNTKTFFVHVSHGIEGFKKYSSKKRTFHCWREPITLIALLVTKRS